MIRWRQEGCLIAVVSVHREQGMSEGDPDIITIHAAPLVIPKRGAERSFLQGVVERGEGDYFDTCEEIPTMGLPEETGIYTCTIEFFNDRQGFDPFDDNEYHYDYTITEAVKVVDFDTLLLPIGKSRELTEEESIAFLESSLAKYQKKRKEPLLESHGNTE